MSRTPKIVAAQPAELVAQPAVQIDRSKLTIGDMRLFGQLSISAGNVSPELLGQMVDMLDRLVVGGASHLPYAELPGVIAAVATQLNAAGNPGN